MPKIGLIVRSDHGGLGYQTKALYDLLKPHKTLLIDSTPFNGREQHPEWYVTQQVSDGFLDDDDLDRFLRDIEVAISCEIFYHDKFVDVARERGIKTIIQPNPELNPFQYHPHLTKPDAFFLPSPWYQEQLSNMCKTYLCPPPIDMQQQPLLPLHKEKGVLNALHVTGRRAYMDRNGTELLRAIDKMRGVNITVLDQSTNPVEHPSDLYKGDYHVLVLPRRYGGLSLPMYEALAHNMPVIMPALSPNNLVLPQEWLTYVSVHIPYNTKSRVRGGITKPKHIARKLVEFRDMGSEEFNAERLKARSVFDTYYSNLSKWNEYIAEVVSQ